MTMRKPARLSFPDWVELQVRTAEDQGAFDNLPGKGKPIPDIDRPQHEMAWIVGKLRSENIDIATVLPPALALAKEVESLPERLHTERREDRVRALITDLNQRIRRAQLAPQNGPPMRVRTVNVDGAVAQWRAAITEDEARTRAQPTAPSPPISGRGLFRRRRAGS